MAERSPWQPGSLPGDRSDDHLRDADEQTLVAAFERARLATVGPPAVTLFGPGAVDRLPWPGPVWVVTAHNPGGSRAHDADNDRRHDALLQARHRLGVDPIEVDAGGPEWIERSVLLASDQTHTDEVFALAERFGQHSVFELTDDRIRIVRVRDRRILSDRPRT